MTIDLYFRENLLYAARSIDDKSRPLDTYDRFPTHLLLFEDTVLRGDFLLCVCQQRHVQVMFVAKVGLSLDFVRTDPDDDDTFICELIFGIAEPASLFRSPGGVGL